VPRARNTLVATPFKPSFGVTPPVVVGRDNEIDDFAAAIDEGPGSAGRATLYTGARGTGKTVMLNAIEDVARERGWLVISETATPGFIERITRQELPRLLRDFDLKAVKSRLTGIAGPLNLGGATWQTVEQHIVMAGLRNQLELLTDILAEHETGVLITVDEIHRRQIGELRELATTVQHAFREERDVAFAGAGLASAITDVLNDDVLTFLRRADRYHLGYVSPDDIRVALRQPIERAGRGITDEALDVMVEGTWGYPFLIQLVGASAWQVDPRDHQISADDARLGVSRAQRRLASLVHEPALAHTSARDKSFLHAMAADDGPSRISDIQRRLGVEKSYANVYRTRLIGAELIEPAGHGRVAFALPYLREYLREHAGDAR
jgi:hypothetical protein